MPDAVTVDLYGIVNCEQVKKARRWLEEEGVTHHFHDFKKEPPDAALVTGWLKRVGWDTVVNRRGTTWRSLAETRRPKDDASALVAVLEQPSLIKRPVLVAKGQLVFGFDSEKYLQLLG